MLDSLRQGAKSPIAKVLFFLLVASFAVWGVGDIFRASPSDYVARIGDDGITAIEFQNEYQLMVNRLSQQTGGQIDSIQARRLGYAEQVLESMITRKTFELNVRDLGLTVSDERLTEEIVALPAFSSATGSFSEQTYDELLRLNGLTRQSFEASLRAEMAQRQLVDSVTAGLKAPKKMAESIFKYRNERRLVEYLVLPPELAGTIEEPGEETLKAYYEENLPLFFAPEYRSFTYLRIEPLDLKNQVEVDEEEISAAYEFSRDRFATPERRTVQIIPFLTEEDARAAHEKIVTDGAEFVAVAVENGFTETEITRDNVTEFDITDTVLARAAFSLEKDVISVPTNGQLTWALLRVTGITEGEDLDPEAAKQQLRDEYILDAAKDALYDAIGILEDELAAGATIEEAAETLNLPATIVALADRDGNAPDGQSRRLFPQDIPDFSANIFSGEVGETSEILDTASDGIYVFRVDKIQEAAAKPFAEIQDDVRNIYIDNKRSEKLDALAKDMIRRGRAGTSFEELASEINRSVLTTSPPMSRGYQSDIFQASTSQTLFTLEEGDYHSAPVALGESYVVARIKEIVEADPAEDAIKLSLLRDQLGQSMSNETVQLYLIGLRSRYNVRIYPEMIDTVLGPLPN